MYRMDLWRLSSRMIGVVGVMSTGHCLRVGLEVGVHRIDDCKLSMRAEEKWWQLRARAVLFDAIFCAVAFIVA